MSDLDPREGLPGRSEAELSQEYHERLLLAEHKDWEINEAVLRPMFQTGPRFWMLVGVLSAIVAWGLFAWGYQIYWGMGTAGINRPVYWGLYIATFVFWVGISHAGTMISAVLRLLKAEVLENTSIAVSVDYDDTALDGADVEHRANARQDRKRPSRVDATGRTL
jgi:molybdopterin-containing oxidoreductase family membrane subunit